MYNCTNLECENCTKHRIEKIELTIRMPNGNMKAQQVLQVDVQHLGLIKRYEENNEQ